MNNLIKHYPSEILEIASKQITDVIDDIIAIVPVYDRGFIAVIDSFSEPVKYAPIIQVGTYGKDFINLSQSLRRFYNYDEAFVALLTFRNMGEGHNTAVYVDIFCNRIGFTTHGNSINPSFEPNN